MSKLDWDAILDEELIENDEPEYITLPEGDYKFKVDDITYSEYNGSDKIPACKSARLSAIVDTDKGKAYASYSFYLYEGDGMKRISRFIKSLGMDAKNQPLGFLFKKAVSENLEGYAHIVPHEYNGNTYNNIAYFKTNNEDKKAENSWDKI